MAKKLIQDIFVKGKPADRPERGIIRPAVAPTPVQKPVRDSVDEEERIDDNDTPAISKRQDFRKIFEERRRSFSAVGYPADPEEKVSGNSRMFLWALCIIVVGVVIFFVSSVFASATVTVTPKSEPVALNDLYMITTSTSTAESLGLHYQIIAASTTLSQPVVTNGTENVARKATGKAIIYNNYSSASEKLVINTRLETSAGLIYHITQSVTVPGIHTVNGTKTPGSVEVPIIADAPGADYNMKLSDLKGDFTIPGLQGKPEYSSFYARLSADAAGGIVGTVKTASGDVITAARNELKNQLAANLVKTVSDQAAGNSETFFKGDYFISYGDLPDAPDVTTYVVSESAAMYAIVFDNASLASFIARNKLSDYDGTSSVDAIWNPDMSVSVSGMTATPWLERQLKATFSGGGKIVWSYDAQKIKDELQGQDKSVLATVADEQKPAVSGMTAKITPPWAGAFPKNADKIQIVDTIRGTGGQ
ncbi:MAG: hypothetical protein KGH93_01765 [Patescibacteria group bacterium]|nr:hypothetical protein [Patescibacteria group bacterium]MDE1945904.1 hypothetical protein [Patescibacteria group bacterium]